MEPKSCFKRVVSLEEPVVNCPPSRYPRRESARFDAGLLQVTAPAVGRGPKPGVAQRIGQALAHMVRHLDRPLSVAELAGVAGLSPSYFYALFKHQTGCTPIVHLNELRMRQARVLLESSDLSVKEIAGALGFRDAFYFSRVFKSANGIPPSRFRQDCKPAVSRSAKASGHSVMLRAVRIPGQRRGAWETTLEAAR